MKHTLLTSVLLALALSVARAGEKTGPEFLYGIWGYEGGQFPPAIPDFQPPNKLIFAGLGEKRPAS